MIDYPLIFVLILTDMIYLTFLESQLKDQLNLQCVDHQRWPQRVLGKSRLLHHQGLAVMYQCQNLSIKYISWHHKGIFLASPFA
jgi:hypothetical protein